MVSNRTSAGRVAGGSPLTVNPSPTAVAAASPSCPYLASTGAGSSRRERLRLLALQLLGLALRRWSGGRPQAHGGPLRILVMRPDHLGDALFATPALRLLRERYPSAHLGALIGPWVEPILRHGPPLDEILTCDFPWFNRHPRRSVWEPYEVLWREAQRLQTAKYDVVVNLRFDFWWGALLAHCAQIPVRLGYDVAACRPFLTRYEPYVSHRHEVAQNLGLVEALATLIPPERRATAGGLEFHIQNAESAEAARLLEAVGVGAERRLVALHPGAGAPAKRWTVEGFAALADALADEYGVQVVLTGAASEVELARQVQARSRSQPPSLAGKTDLGSLAAIFQRCHLAVGVDSGAMHLAVAAGTPTVHLFGPSDPVAFGPYGDSSQHRVVRADLPCPPCGRFQGSTEPAECMRAITLEQVLAAVGKVMDLNARDGQ